MRHSALAARAMRASFALLALALMAACDDAGPAEAPAGSTIEREVFVATYVDLRSAAVRNEDTRIHDDQRAAVLQRHDVTEDNLITFASAHGGDVAYMRQVWDEVERRLDAQRLSEDGGDVRR